eukprot:CAMPEP_0172488786 /NCGR_PEP_ID=MMETSP1066-20121228/18518_1 /TAXON_ID=671091 /ORGANISM="Coscinodiscus wailesii, Strain CCMP2513" /LENGTH=651 /DNA_ID=CAMNT_0013256243 /DNA_START=59 /DNA_END=2014 /DNA_ORIENTATION=-
MILRGPFTCLITLLSSSLRGCSAEDSIFLVGPTDYERAHTGNRHLFEFDNPSCGDAEYAAQPFFISPSNGNDWSMENGWGLSTDKPFKTIQHAVDRRGACQTIYVMEGVYRNNYYGQSYNHNNKVVDIRGVSDLKILAHPNVTSRPILEFDGPGGIFGGSVSNPISNIEIAGLEIRGPNEAISYEEAMANRLIKRTYYTGRGIAIWAGHHIYIHDMKVHHCPASGIRVNKGDYVTIADSEVYSNTWWSRSAESAIVLAESINIDDNEWVKMRLTNNIVYDNINKIPYYNPSYAWDYTPIGGEDCSSYSACFQELTEGCPWECRYGKKTQDYIIDGMGVYVTRNSDTYLHGQMELSDNIAYGNGINGVVFHRTDRGVVKRNTVYGNGVVPHMDYDEPVVEDWHVNLSKSRQAYSGIVLNSAEGVKLWSNNVAARYDKDYAFNTVEDGGATPPPLAAGGNNKVCKGLVSPELESVVNEETDPSVCGILVSASPTPNSISQPTKQPVTSAPTPSPSKFLVTSEPTTSGPSILTNVPTVVPAKYIEISCGDRCHLIQWPYIMGSSYNSSVAYQECENDCDNTDCKAFSLQFDYRTDFTGNKHCFLYKASKEPSPETCANDPFNQLLCTYPTGGGQFYITPAAMVKYNVLHLGQHF